MVFLAYLYGVVLLYMVGSAVGSWAIITAVGGRVTAISLGGKLLVRQVGKLEVTFGLWPGASVKLLGEGEDDLVDDPRYWERLHPARRLVGLILPWLASAAVAAACLGWSRALSSIANAFRQLLLVLDPTPLVRGLAQLVDSAPFAVVFGVVATKLLVMNLLLYAPMAFRKRAPHGVGDAEAKAWVFPMLVMFALALWILGRFGYAIVRVAIAG